MTKSPLLDALAGGLIVSCQAYPGEPMQSPEVMVAVARSVAHAGARAVRLQGIPDIAAARAVLPVPIIGLVKVDLPGVFITPTLEDVEAVCRAGADIVAVDGTLRPRPDGHTLRDSIEAAHAMGKLLMADCGSLEDVEYSVGQGADLVGTTLAGYTEGRPRTNGPDLELLRDVVERTAVPVLAEGRIGTPHEAAECLQAGAFAVVVGTAITHPGRIARRFIDALGGGVDV
jgi:N-acylglucosamine-6-phosphate 2-epimerase